MKRINIYINEDQHRELTKLAVKAGGSGYSEIIRQGINEFLDEGKKMKSIYDFLRFDVVGMEKYENKNVIRVECSSTHRAEGILVNIIDALTKEIEKISLYCFPDPNNGGNFIPVIELPGAVFLLDKSMLNIDRRPRAMEMREIMKKLLDRSLEGRVLACFKQVESTRGLTPSKAYETLKTHDLRQLAANENEIFDFFSFLSPGVNREVFTKDNLYELKSYLPSL